MSEFPPHSSSSTLTASSRTAVSRQSDVGNRETSPVVGLDLASHVKREVCSQRSFETWFFNFLWPPAKLVRLFTFKQPHSFITILLFKPKPFIRLVFYEFAVLIFIIIHPSNAVAPKVVALDRHWPKGNWAKACGV